MSQMYEKSMKSLAARYEDPRYFPTIRSERYFALQGVIARELAGLFDEDEEWVRLQQLARPANPYAVDMPYLNEKGVVGVAASLYIQGELDGELLTLPWVMSRRAGERIQRAEHRYVSHFPVSVEALTSKTVRRMLPPKDGVTAHSRLSELTAQSFVVTIEDETPVFLIDAYNSLPASFVESAQAKDSLAAALELLPPMRFVYNRSLYGEKHPTKGIYVRE